MALLVVDAVEGAERTGRFVMRRMKMARGMSQPRRA